MDGHCSVDVTQSESDLPDFNIISLGFGLDRHVLNKIVCLGKEKSP